MICHTPTPSASRSGFRPRRRAGGHYCSVIEQDSLYSDKDDTVKMKTSKILSRSSNKSYNLLGEHVFFDVEKEGIVAL